MTPEEAQAHIDDHRIQQAKLRDELVHTLTGWSPGEDTSRARELFAAVLRLETLVDQLKMRLPNFGEDTES